MSTRNQRVVGYGTGVDVQFVEIQQTRSTCEEQHGGTLSYRKGQPSICETLFCQAQLICEVLNTAGHNERCVESRNRCRRVPGIPWHLALD